MKHNWQKNYIRIPVHIKNALKRLKSDDLVVGVAKRIKKSEIENGNYVHLGIKYENGMLDYKKIITPLDSTGRYSSYNINGREISRKDLPMISKTYSYDVPNFGDWSKGSHEVTYEKKVYKKEYWLPRYIEIKIDLLGEDEQYIKFKFSLSEFISRNDINFEDTLLYHCNLLQENCGLCNIFEANSSDEEYIATLYVDWDLLPPGTENIDKNRVTILKHFINPPPEITKTLNDRLVFFEKLKPIKYILGTNRFSKYFGALFENNIVLLENVRYGNAIYIFFENWEDLSKLSRTELLNSSNKNFIRIPHTTGWKTMVKSTIEAYIE